MFTYQTCAPSGQEFKHPLTAALLSLVPGAGQLYIGDLRKGILFINVALANWILCLLCLSALRISHYLTRCAPGWHMRINEQLVDSLKQMQLGSPASLLIICLAIAFCLYCARDAYDRAFFSRRRGIYKDNVIDLSEASSGSYLLHASLIAASAILAIFFIAAPPRITQTTRIVILANEATPTKVRPVTNAISRVQSEERGRTQERQSEAKTAAAAPSARANSSASRSAISQSRTVAAQPSPVAPRPRPQPPLPAPSTATPVPHPTNAVVPRASLLAAAMSTVAPTPAHAESMNRNFALPVPTAHLARSTALPAVPATVVPSAIVALPGAQALSRITSDAVPSLAGLLGPKTTRAAEAGQPAPVAVSTNAGRSGNGPLTPQPVASGTSRMSISGDNNAPSPQRAKMPSTDGRLLAVAPTTGRQSQGVVPSIGANGQDHDLRAKGADDTNQTPAAHSRRDGLPAAGSIKDVDFTEYMAKLQRKIRRYWTPPKQPTSRQAILTFSISRGGEVSNLRVANFSGYYDSDQAAMQAVRDAQPLPALPEGAPPSVDIEFTFTYDVFSGGAGRFRRL